jgi:hypothetical protein
LFVLTAGVMEFAAVALSDALRGQHHGAVDRCIRPRPVRID